ncbi:MAG: DUF885 domain-containing protein [Bifidobacteriaceae bacterium]|jgi:uncharacterized protein (DUF885 family)|nr:DUF885 domain-containing protein [Bifidobacteriaceae bacterium]
MSEIDKICNDYFLETLKEEPENALQFGLQGKVDNPNGFADYSPAGIEKQIKITQNYVEKMKNAKAETFEDSIVKEQFLQVLELSLEAESKFHDSYRQINNLFSPVQMFSRIFDFLNRETEKDFSNIAERLENLPKAVSQYTQSLEAGLEKSVVSSKRQVKLVIEQIRNQINPESSYFYTIQNDCKKLFESKAVSQPLYKRVENAIENVIAAFKKLLDFFENTYLQKACDEDAVGIERYEYYAKEFVGQKINVEKSYLYGVEQIDQIIEQQFSLAKEFGAKSLDKVEAIKEAAKILDSDPNQVIEGPENLKNYMQDIADITMKYLIDNDHFEIPEPVQKVEAMIATTDVGAVYYTPPANDFSTPGRMWWSIPKGVDKQYKWNSKTTIFHEGVPGHHLQVGLQVYLSDKLNDWRRMGLLISGYAEGWGLYAEQLMDEFGALNSAEKFGMLDMQKFRAARIIIDIGVHCKLEVPKHWERRYGSGVWNYEKAEKFLSDMVNMNIGFRKFELDRYMGMPGQAISYKLGQKNWLELRDKALSKGWTLKEFHKRALSFACLSFDLLDKALFSDKI